MKYRVNYTYDGYGSSIVSAKNKQEAEDKFYEGDFEEDADNSRNYEIDTIINEKSNEK